MGWSSGTQPFCQIAVAVKENVTSKHTRKVLYQAMYDAFTDMDWDCTDEALGIDPILDRIINKG